MTREVANLKGITPETLSRHVHGKIQMTLQDAEQYGKILDCLPQDVLFALSLYLSWGYVHITMDNVLQRDCSWQKNGQSTQTVQRQTVAPLWYTAQMKAMPADGIITEMQ